VAGALGVAGCGVVLPPGALGAGVGAAVGVGAGGVGVAGALAAGVAAATGFLAGFLRGVVARPPAFLVPAFLRGVALVAPFFRGAAFAFGFVTFVRAAGFRAFAFGVDFFFAFFALAFAFFLADARPRSNSRRAASVPAFTAFAALEAFRAMPRAVRSAALRRAGAFLRSAATFLRTFLAALPAPFFTFVAAVDADLASRFAVFEAFFRRPGAFLRALAAARLAALPTAPALARTFFAALLAVPLTLEAARLRDAALVRVLALATFFFDRAFCDAFFRPPTFVAMNASKETVTSRSSGCPKIRAGGRRVHSCVGTGSSAEHVASKPVAA
jgi:hypothetical protein